MGCLRVGQRRLFREEPSHETIWGNCIPRRGNSTCKSPEVGMILLYLKGREKCGENGAEQARTKGSRNGGHGQIVWGPIAMERSSDFILSAVKAVGGI